MGKYLDMLRELDNEVAPSPPLVSHPEVIQFPKVLTPADVNAFLAPCEPLEDDLKFIHRNLPSGPKERRHTIVHYRRIWLAAMDAEPARHRKQNAGRAAANIWLRTGATP